MFASAPALLLIGCANPGPPRPPSLQLPQVPSDLRAERIGNIVHLSWTTSSDTTDDLPLRGALTAEICRTEAPAPPFTQAGSQSATRPGTGNPGCSWSRRLTVAPGASAADDALTDPALTADPLRLLVYTVRLENGAGRSAGISPPAFAAAGGAPPPVADLRIAPRRSGAQLTWQPTSGSDAAFELLRTQPAPVPAPDATVKPPRPARKLPAARHPSAGVRLLAAPAGHPDPGGALDLAAPPGVALAYQAERVRTVVLAGHTLILRSAPAPSITATLNDVFPPATPLGLVTVDATRSPTEPAVDLSWEPVADADLAGYLVERAATAADEGSPSAWQRLTSPPATTPALHDGAVVTGSRYRYRVAAVDGHGNQSPWSAPATVVLSPTPPPSP